VRLRLFGQDVAYRDSHIHFTDLADNDLATLRNEGLTMLPDKDLASGA
jgi:hypothetical protein